MARLTEEMVIARSKQSDLSAIKKLNCWGAELGDVSLLRRMPNVEVLALSINKIRTLGDFAWCRRLRELYVRKNEIRSLAEIRHLRRLPDLTSLWLDENPCTLHPEYRLTVLRNLPQLEKLDNVSVQAEEVAEALRRGTPFPDSDDEGYPHQESFGSGRRVRSCDSSPDRDARRYSPRRQGSDSSETGLEPTTETSRNDVPPIQSPASGSRSPDSDARCDHPAMTRSAYDPRGGGRSPDAALRHSFSAQSVKEYSYSNGDCRYSGVGGGGGGGGLAGGGEHYQDAYYEKPERSEPYPAPPGSAGAGAGAGAGGRGEWEQDRASARERDREYPSAVMQEHRGFTRRPVARNSNLLSAVLCLVKELDYPSLEVAEMAVRCRMDELANSQ